MPDPLPTQADAVRLHERLVAGDRVAPSELAEAYLQPLIDHLAQTERRAPQDFRDSAASEALMALMKNPASYDPTRRGLFPYLCMSARGDLRNALQKEDRHRRGRPGLTRVELPPDDGKYLGREDDPSLRLCADESRDAAHDPAVAAVMASATREERIVLELILAGERSYDVIAAAIGLGDLPPAEKKVAVKRLTDRMKARLKRARRPT
jgi:DNA-directed RNA polymerase specialized sigma24 family protein